MSWGGGGFGGGLGGAPGGFGRPAAPGLPFAGIPSELQDGVDLLLKSEPDYAEPDIVFNQNGSEDELKRLSLWRLLTKYPGMLALAGVLVVAISVFAQTGPKFTEIAINDGLYPHKDFAIVARLVCKERSCDSKASRDSGESVSSILRTMPSWPPLVKSCSIR